MSASGNLWVVGYGAGLGESLVSRFAREGFDVTALSRHTPDSALTAARHDRLDVLAPDVSERLSRLMADHGVPDVLVYNVGMFLRGAWSELSEADFRACWERMVLGAFRIAKDVLPAMATRGSGSAIFSGATASLRGGAEFAAFASAKFALRGLVQALARSYQPAGVHVAHVILDGVIAGSARGTQYIARLDPDAIAECYWTLSQQPSGAWTHELDLRGANEPF